MLIVQPKVFGDARGFFLESFNQRQFDAAVGAPVSFVQDNHSRSAQGVLRGLHLQVGAARAGQAGAGDERADLRRRGRRPAGSPTFGQWVGVELDDVAHRQLWIPPGLAHGFLVLSESADVQYKTTDYYSPADEVGIRWDDPALAIAWPDLGMPYALSAKDRAAPTLDAALPSR